MNIVLDTNVLISGFLTPYGEASEILKMIGHGKVTLLYDTRIFSEYHEVLLRPKFRFDAKKVEVWLDFVESFGKEVSAFPLFVDLPDPFDRAFLEVAQTGGADFLVTYNLKHFPKASCGDISVVSPFQFLKQFQIGDKP